jgi:hypothetical protein
MAALQRMRMLTPPVPVASDAAGESESGARAIPGLAPRHDAVVQLIEDLGCDFGGDVTARAGAPYMSVHGKLQERKAPPVAGGAS